MSRVVSSAGRRSFVLVMCAAIMATVLGISSPGVQGAEDGKMRIIVFGAHPDDCEIRVGGAAAKWAKLSHKVKFVSATNGDIGHAVMAGGQLAQRRIKEAQEAAKVLGIETEVLDIHDGEIMPTLENRRTFIRLIREWKADIVISNRPWDYHPDHRYTAILVQDAAYMVTVPFICPDVPYLEDNPIFLYWSDRFQKPIPFQPDIVVGIDDVLEQKYQALHRMESQFYEFGCEGTDPSKWIEKDDTKRLEWLKGHRMFGVQDSWRPVLEQFYGKEEAKRIKNAEAFEICELGRRPSKEEIKKLFPFFPDSPK